MLPKNLLYGSKVESASARSYRSNIAPQNGTGTYNAGDTIIINIPTRNNLVFAPAESYLKFLCTCTATAACNYIRLDSGGAHGLIQRIRVFHGSNLLSDIDNYGMLSKMLFDLQVSSDAAYGKHNILSGTRNDLAVKIPTLVAADFTNHLFSNYTISALPANSGYRFNNAAIAQNGTTSQTFCINLISLVGTLCKDKYFPLFACTSAPLRVEIQLASALNAAASVAAASTFALTNVEYIAQMIELSDSAMNIIQSSLNGAPLQFVNPDYRNYSYTATLTQNVATQVTFPIPAKFSSLKSLFISLRDSANIATNTYFPYSSCKFGISSYYFRIGSQIMPPRAPDTTTEMFAEVVKAIGSMSDLNHQPSIDLTSYTLDVTAANAGDAAVGLDTAVYGSSSINSGSFYIGLDLENYCDADKTAIFSGYNSNTDDIYLFSTHTAAATVTGRYDSFALFDSLLVFQNGTVYTKF